jgi:hypothetical protein
MFAYKLPADKAARSLRRLGVAVGGWLVRLIVPERESLTAFHFVYESQSVVGYAAMIARILVNRSLMGGSVRLGGVLCFIVFLI